MHLLHVEEKHIMSFITASPTQSHNLSIIICPISLVHSFGGKVINFISQRQFTLYCVTISISYGTIIIIMARTLALSLFLMHTRRTN